MGQNVIVKILVQTIVHTVDIKVLIKCGKYYGKHTQESKQFSIFLKKEIKYIGNYHVVRCKCSNTEGCLLVLLLLLFQIFIISDRHSDKTR